MENMLKNILIDRSTINAHARILDLASLKNKLLASNIANVETPGYERRTLDFDKELRKSMEGEGLKGTVTDPKHIPLGDSSDKAPKIKSVKHTENSTGINSVDIDQEMGELAQNQLIYQFSSKLLNKKFNSIREVIKSK